MDQDILVKSRGYTRARLTKLLSEIRGNFPNLTPSDTVRYIDRLNNFKVELDEQNKELFPVFVKSKISEEELDSKISEQEVYDNQILDTLHQLKYPSNTPVPTSNSQGIIPPNFSGNQNPTNLKLPRLPLPKFSNEKNESFRKFIHSFEAIVDKYSISSYEKFCYLRDQLSKGPRILIDSLNVEKQLYETGKELLQKAFDDEVETKFDIIKQMTELKLGINDDPYVFIGDMRTIIAEIDTLKICMDEVVQYFVWQGLNSRFQDHLISITNKSKPSIREILDNIFEATNRYNKLSKIERNFSNKIQKNDFKDYGREFPKPSTKKHHQHFRYKH